MFATLWDILLCILIDENVEEDFWKYAAETKSLSRTQIKQRKPDPASTLLKTKMERPYISAAISFANSSNVPQHVSEKILRNIKMYHKRI